MKHLRPIEKRLSKKDKTNSSAPFHAARNRCRCTALALLVPAIGVWADPSQRVEMINKIKKDGRIRNFEGVEKLELFEDNSQNNVLFTYSVWKDLHHLESQLDQTKRRMDALDREVAIRYGDYFGARPDTIKYQ